LPDTEERTEEDLIMLPELVSASGGRARDGDPVLLHGLKQREIGALIGCSQMQVSRLLRRSCERLHGRLGVSEA
jgi:hypothetical protein